MSTIIKSSQAESLGSLAPLRLAQLDAPGGAGSADADQIVAHARREAESIRAAAFAEGLAAAEREFDERCRRQIAGSLAQLASSVRHAIEGVENARTQCLAQWEEMAVHLAVAIAQRLVRRELREAPEISLQLIRESLELAAGAADVELHLHPADHALLAAPLERLLDSLPASSQVRVVADANISPGGCRVDTRFGSIDQQLETQLARIEQELLGPRTRGAAA